MIQEQNSVADKWTTPPRFADYIDLLVDMKEGLQDLKLRVDESIKRIGLKKNADKTETIGKQPEELQVRLGGGGARAGHEVCLSWRPDSGGRLM